MLIGLHGKKQAGKDTVYGRIWQLLGPYSQTGARVDRVSFADKLYESAAAALGISVTQLQGWKSDPDARVVTGVYFQDLGIPQPFSNITVRDYLQRYGTEAHRDLFGPDFWTSQVDLTHEGRIVCVTDVRFPNEAQAVSDAGGAVVHVVGPPEIEEAGDGHASEEPLPGCLIDHYISNAVRDDGFRSLDSQVLEMVLNLLREERVRS